MHLGAARLRTGFLAAKGEYRVGGSVNRKRNAVVLMARRPCFGDCPRGSALHLAPRALRRGRLVKREKVLHAGCCSMSRHPTRDPFSPPTARSQFADVEFKESSELLSKAEIIHQHAAVLQ